MARTALNYDLQTKTARAKLKPRWKPYFMQVGEGKTLGYIRRRDSAGAGWSAICSAGRSSAQPRDGRRRETRRRARRADLRAGACGAYRSRCSATVGKLTVKDALDPLLRQPRGPQQARQRSSHGPIGGSSRARRLPRRPAHEDPDRGMAGRHGPRRSRRRRTRGAGRRTPPTAS